MATLVMPLTFLLATFLHLGWTLPQPQGNPRPKLTITPEPAYYVGKGSPAKLTCQAIYAEDIIFRCGGTQIPPTSVETDDPFPTDGRESARFSIRASIEIPRSDVVNFRNHKRREMQKEREPGRKYGKPEPYWCECAVIDEDMVELETSERSVIHIAHLRSTWADNPQSRLVNAGATTEILCGAPHGVPRPLISWVKDGEALLTSESDRLLITDQGSLVIQDVTPDDAGMYMCVAENPAGRRESLEAELSVRAVAESAEPSVEIRDASGRRVEVIKSRAPRQTSSASGRRHSFHPKLKSRYVVRPGRDVEMSCGITEVQSVRLTCNGLLMANPERQELKDGTRYWKATAVVTHDDLKNKYMDYVSKDDFSMKCRCDGVMYDSNQNDWITVISSREEAGTLRFTYLKDITDGPSDTTVQRGSDAKFSCNLPEAYPRIREPIVWFKDGRQLDMRRIDQKYEVPVDGNLVVKTVDTTDEGDYACFVSTSYHNKTSDPARLTVTDEVVTTTPSTGDGRVDYKLPSQPPRKPTFIVDLKDNYIVEEGKDKIDLDVVALSANQLTFNCEGIDGRIKEGSPYLMTKSDEREDGFQLLRATLSLPVTEIEKAGGSVTCGADAWYLDGTSWVNGVGKKAFIRLENQQGPYLGVNFEREPESTEAYVGDEVRIYCSPPDANPPAQIIWLKDGNKRVNVNRRDIEVLTDHTLVIRRVRQEDAGPYSCYASNSEGSRFSGQAQLTVRERVDTPTAPQVTRPAITTTPSPVTTSTTVTEGVDPTEDDSDLPELTEDLEEVYYVTRTKPAMLTCAAWNAYMVSFACNDEEIEDSKRTSTSTHYPIEGRTEQVSNNSYKLPYSTVRQSRIRPYICRCWAHFYNKNGEREIAEGADATIEIAYLRKAFRQEPEPIRPSRGDTVTLGCIPPDGVPRPEVYWQKDGASLPENPYKYQVEEEGNLIINQFTEADDGEYTCVARNEAQTRLSMPASVYLDLIVDPVPAGTPGYRESTTTPSGVVVDPARFQDPYFSKDLRMAYYIVRGQPTDMLCEAVHVQTMTVDCAGTDVKAVITERADSHRKEDGQVIINEITTATFQLTEEDLAQFSQTFNCRCTGYYTDKMGQEQRIESTIAYVQESFMGEVFTQDPTPVESTLEEGRSIQLICRPPESVPSATVTWEKDGEMLSSTRDMLVIPGGALAFTSLTKEHSGSYLCVASNAAGERRSKVATLTVISPEDKEKEGDMATTVPGEGGEEGDGRTSRATTPIAASTVSSTAQSVSGDQETTTAATPVGPDQMSGEGTTTPGAAMTVEIGSEGASVSETTLSSATASVSGIDVAGTTQKGEMKVDPSGASSTKVDGVVVVFTGSTKEKEVEGTASTEGDAQSGESTAGQDVASTQTSEGATQSTGGVEGAKDTPTDGGTMTGEKSDGGTTTVSEGGEGEGAGIIVTESTVGEDEGSDKKVTDMVVTEGGSDGSMDEKSDGNTEEGMDDKSEGEGEGSMDEKDMDRNGNVLTDPTEGGEEEKGGDMDENKTSQEQPAPSEGGDESDGKEGEEDKEGDDMEKGDAAVPSVDEDASEEKMCMTKLMTCTGLKPNSVDTCQNNMEEFKTCVEEFEGDCVKDDSHQSYGILLEHKETVDEDCAALASCAEKISACQESFTDSEMDDAFKVQEFCTQQTEYMECINNAITEECNIMTEGPEEGVYPGLDHVKDWLSSYCTHLVEGEVSVVGCEGMKECRLNINPSHDYYDNITLWCSTVTDLVACTGSAIEGCGLEDLKQPFMELEEQADSIYCLLEATTTETPGTEGDNGDGGENGGDGEEEGNAGEEGENQTEDGGSEEGQTGNQQDTDSASGVGVPFLLTAALQFLVAAILSRR